ncbi:hypothetical protein QFC22_006396 [Naganishia vaughanmartiniae]|uniref:Uncharacterized protein n=1 Tax=Naganishia vaughanmartiniae TaxID=1424756 RepID=A0ACC2WLZ3_9TREE|nr:hypothetical protein QFC22_006396 [Naganishia vaughanmartiniae]
MRLNHSGLTVCVLAMLNDVSRGALANPLATDKGAMVANERDARPDAPDMHPRGAHPAATGSCRHREQGDGAPHRKVRIQHSNANAQQKMASVSTGEQNPERKPEEPAKTEDPTNNQNGEASHADSENATPSSTGAVSTTQNADTSKTHSEVPSVQVPALKPGQRAGKSIDSNAVTNDMKKQLVELHNKLRTANGAGEVQWDDKIAQYSTGWMKNCIWEHSHG